MKDITENHAGAVPEKHSFMIKNKKVEVYPSALPDSPIIYLNTFSGEGGDVWKELRRIGCPDLTLVAISGLKWDHDMSPWEIPPIRKGDTPCTGGADDYLQLLLTEIMPEAERTAPGRILWRGLVGYSLAGLFALYSIYQTDIFLRIASISGSLWFPEFQEYVFSHEMKRIPEHLYLSLGDKECKTKNPYLKTVQERTEKIRDFYVQKGIDTTFCLNSGNHFKDAVQRTAAGIAWISESAFTGAAYGQQLPFNAFKR